MGEMSGGSDYGYNSGYEARDEVRKLEKKVDRLEKLTTALLDRVNQLVQFHGIVPIDPEQKP